MISGQKRRSEKEYRAIQMDSSSSLKDFSMDRKKYYRKYVLQEKVEDKDNQAITIGKLVETILMEPEEFDNIFFMSSAIAEPSGLMLNFVNALYDVTVESTDELGVVSKTFEQLSREAYVISGFKLTYEAVINKFIGGDAEIYYQEIRTVKSKGLIVVNGKDVNNAENIVQELRQNFVTKDIVNLVSSARFEVYNQFSIEGFESDGHKLKGLLDKLIVDHTKRTLQLIDLKCTWTVENFYSEYYLYRRAYIQAFVYYKGCQHLVYDVDSEWYGYEVLKPMFLVCDSTNYYNPLIYTLTESDILDAYNGFEHNGRKYPGVKEIITDLKWALANGVWGMSRVNSLNKGILNIKS